MKAGLISERARAEGPLCQPLLEYRVQVESNIVQSFFPLKVKCFQSFSFHPLASHSWFWFQEDRGA